eukprot:CAMPEP_0206487906 /NCGR_PEP_ID=MMETSP0324_2-20121206/41996_1 /ASSEMBLY_ACC=CAM_ASM_000836 /TAXON_ID=2866 /ORGANISM="Crypthecodinium cohnii, Strain Seligo" /LENGTH=95 /DNA_ID=CAMNT_0053966629 /DNA_START=189 /DNA_END=476 /DNA_ORIENTATION=+
MSEETAATTQGRSKRVMVQKAEKAPSWCSSLGSQSVSSSKIAAAETAASIAESSKESNEKDRTAALLAQTRSRHPPTWLSLSLWPPARPNMSGKD